MITLEKLRDYGADVEEGLIRCMNKEEFYLMLVGRAAEDTRLEELEHQLSAHDLDGAFESAYALKGTYGDLSLTPLSQPIDEMTELLRNRTDTDYTVLLEEAKVQLERLGEL